MIVIDASPLLDLLVNSTKAHAVRRQDEASGGLAAPDLIYVEVTSAISRLVRADAVPVAEADTAVAALESLPLRSMPHSVLVAPVWRMRDAVRIADAFYVACAERLDCPLLTTDGRLSRATLPDLSVILVT